MGRRVGSHMGSWVGLFLLGALGAGVVGMVALDRWGNQGALAFGVALLLVPVMIAVVVERAASIVGTNIRKRRVVLALVPVGTIATAITMLVVMPDATVDGITRQLHLSRGDASVDAGASASASATTSAFGAASAAASAITSPSPSASASAPSPRFSAGDPTYTEPGDACATLADVSAVAAAHTPANVRATATALAKARYPAGVAFIDAQDDRMLKTWLTGAPESFEGLVSRFDPVVHEGSHMWVAKRFAIDKVSYPVRSDLTITTRRLKNFDRSEILSVHEDPSDSYAKTYLTGSSGAQGFNTLLDEYNAYVHSLAARFCTRDFIAQGQRVSARDGILAMMFYVETYLRLAREKHPADYAAIAADPGHRKLIATVWDRAELWLRRSVPFPQLGIDQAMEARVYAPERLAEIQRLR